MKILIVGGSPAHRGGLEVFTTRAMSAMVEYGGHEVGVIPTNTAYVRPRSLPLLWASLRRLAAERRQGWDLVWLQYVNLFDLAFLFACRVFGYKVLVTPHLGANWQSQRNRILRFLSKSLLRGANAVGLLASTQKIDIALPERMRTFMTPTWLPRAAEDAVPAASKGVKLKLMHASRLSVEKGSFVALDLCRRLVDQGHNFHLYMAGSCAAETTASLVEAVTRLDLADHVTIVGPLDEQALMKVLMEMDILVHPSTIDSYPLILLEAIACGVYPVCLDLAGSRAIVANYCGRALSPNAFVEEAAAFIEASDLTRLKSEAAVASRRLIGELSWRAGAQRMEEVFGCL